MKPFLLLQSRPEDVTSDDEHRAFCQLSGLDESQLLRVRMDKGELPEVDLNDYSGVFMGGGPGNVSYDESQKSEMQRNFEPWLYGLLGRVIAEDKPFLGVCLGMGMLVKLCGGEVKMGISEPVESVEIVLTEVGRGDQLLKNITDEFSAFVGHKEGVEVAPGGAVELARSATCLQMIRIGANVYGTQFHPELDPGGLAIRVEAYKNLGYFHPDEADDVIAAAWQADVQWPPKILQNFVKVYQQ